MSKNPYALFAKLLPDASNPINLLPKELGLDYITGTLKYKDANGNMHTISSLAIPEDTVITNIGAGLSTQMPEPTNSGSLYITIDTNLIYRDGGKWVIIGHGDTNGNGSGTIGKAIPGYSFGMNDWTNFLTSDKPNMFYYSEMDNGVCIQSAGNTYIDVPLPVDDTAYYKVTIHVRLLSGEVILSCGVDSLDNKFASIKLDGSSDYNYGVVNNASVTTDTTVYSGTFSSHNLTSESSRNKFDPTAKYFRVVLTTSTPTTSTSTIIIDSVEVIRVPNVVVDHINDHELHNVYVEDTGVSNIIQFNAPITMKELKTGQRFSVKVKATNSKDTHVEIANLFRVVPLITNIKPQIRVPINFEGKVTNSTVVNPHVIKHAVSSTLLQPDSSEWVEILSYDNIQSIDNNKLSVVADTVGNMPMILVKYNIFEIYSRLDSAVALLDNSQKLEYFKNLEAKLPISFTINGQVSKPSTDKVNIFIYSRKLETYLQSASSSMEYIHSNLYATSDAIDEDGYVSYLITPSSLDSQGIDSNHIMLENSNLLIGDLVFNNRSKYMSIVKNIYNNKLIEFATPTQTPIIGDPIKQFHKSSTIKIADIDTTSTLLSISKHGLSSGDYVYNITRNIFSEVVVVDINTLTCVTEIPNQSADDVVIRYKWYNTSNIVTGSYKGIELNHIDTYIIGGFGINELTIASIIKDDIIDIVYDGNYFQLISTNKSETNINFVLEKRTSDPVAPVVGSIWLRTDLIV